MKFLRKISSRRGAGSQEPRDPAPLDPKEAAELAREEEFYGVANLSALDGPGLMKALMIHRHHPIYSQLQALGKRYSMLHADVLTLLYYLAKHSPGNVLEIGPYLGGSTMAMAIGLRASDRPGKFVSVEKGGEMVHPRLPSRDIVRDLRQNLAANGLGDLVRLVVGYSLGQETAAMVRQQLPPGSVTLLVIDADGVVQSLFDLYGDLLADRCSVVIDDYFAIGIARQKSGRTKIEVGAAVLAGELEELGFYGWGTWVGRWRRRPERIPKTIAPNE